jgi:putative MATE family efflux protein
MATERPRTIDEVLVEPVPPSQPANLPESAPPATLSSIPVPSVAKADTPILALIGPLLVENMLRASLMSVDTLMLSRYSERAVAAMSIVSQFAFFITLVYMTISVGASILIAQNLGAHRRREAGLVGVASVVLTLGLSLAVSLLVLLFAPGVVGLYNVDPEVARYASQFLRIYGGLSVFMALNVAQSSIVRVWGYSRDPMWVNTFCLVLTVVGNALCLFGLFGFPVLGIAGVAGSTVFSQIVACLVYHLIMKRRPEIKLPMRELRSVPKAVYRAVLSVGIPTVGENLSYNLSQIAILSMIARIGTSALATYGIVLAVLRYVFIPGISIGSGAQIKVGYLVGAGRHDEATGKVYRYFGSGFLISLVLVAALALLRRPVLGVFTGDERLLELAGSVLVIALFHEPGRNFNTIIIPALKGAGDVRFPVYVGVLSMWGISVCGAWLFGLRWGFGLVGVWIAMALDEWVRGIIMLLRWKSGAWKTRTLVATAA